MMILPVPGTYLLLAAFSVMLPSSVAVLPNTSIFPSPVSMVTLFFAVTVSTSGPLSPTRILPLPILAVKSPPLDDRALPISKLPLVIAMSTSFSAVTLPMPWTPTVIFPVPTCMDTLPCWEVTSRPMTILPVSVPRARLFPTVRSSPKVIFPCSLVWA